MHNLLQRKFVLLTTLVSFLALALITLTVNIAIYISVDQGIDTIAYFLIENRYSFPLGYDGRLSNLPTEVAFTTRYFVTTLQKDGEVTALHMDNIHTTNVATAQALTKQVVNSKKDSGWLGDYKFYRINEQDEERILFVNVEERRDIFQLMLTVSAGICFGSLVIIFTLACLLAERVTRPIAESYNRQKLFITNISHELKTPLSIIRANTEVTMLDNPEDEWCSGTIKEVDKLHDMINKLLTLTKLDENKDQLLKTDFSISNAVTETLESFESRIAKKQLALSVQIDPNITYHGDEMMLRTLFSLFIDNMIKYALEETEATITLKKANNKVIFATQNKAENIQAGDYSIWFERFYRADQSRNSSSNGYGIGLSQAKMIAENHKGKVYATSKGNNTITIRAEL